MMDTMFFILLFTPLILLILLGIFQGKPNFCKDCKYYTQYGYCTHPDFKRYNYIDGNSWNPIAQTVREYNCKYCPKWEKKDEMSNT